jgi:hypothetical protein
VIKSPVMIPELTAIPYLLRLFAGIVSPKYMFVAHRLRLPANPYIKRPTQIASRLSISIRPTAKNTEMLL